MEEKKIKGGTITTFSLQKYKAMGLTPYYFDDKTATGGCAFVEVTRSNLAKVERKWVYLLTPEQLGKIQPMVDNVNKMIELHEKKIKLLKEFIPSALVHKILK